MVTKTQRTIKAILDMNAAVSALDDCAHHTALIGGIDGRHLSEELQALRNAAATYLEHLEVIKRESMEPIPPTTFNWKNIK